jgi:hypothetical protein
MYCSGVLVSPVSRSTTMMLRTVSYDGPGANERNIAYEPPCTEMGAASPPSDVEKSRTPSLLKKPGPAEYTGCAPLSPTNCHTRFPTMDASANRGASGAGTSSKVMLDGPLVPLATISKDSCGTCPFGQSRWSKTMYAMPR